MPTLTRPAARAPESGPSDRYRWIVLSNTTLGVFMASLDASIVLISLPAIFRGIHLDPLEAGNVGYLLWMLMGYLVVTAVLVVTFGRLGDIFGRVRMYNAGFAVFSGASLALSLCPYTGTSGALWLIAWRVVQGIGGALLTANSAAILTDAFPAAKRGFAIGVSVIAGMAGAFIGLVVGGILADIDWRAVFWINVPIGVFGTVWAYLMLRELGTRKAARIDWWGNLTFGVGLIMILIGLTYGLIPHGGHVMGWTGPWVLFEIIGGAALLVAFAFIERRVKDPMFDIDCSDRLHDRARGLPIGRGGRSWSSRLGARADTAPTHPCASTVDGPGAVRVDVTRRVPLTELPPVRRSPGRRRGRRDVRRHRMRAGPCTARTPRGRRAIGEPARAREVVRQTDGDQAPRPGVEHARRRSVCCIRRARRREGTASTTRTMSSGSDGSSSCAT